MIKWILQKIVGSKNQREVRRLRPVVARINEIEEALQREPEDKLREFTQKWRDHLARYHDLHAPPKPQLFRMEPEQLREVALALESRFSKLRDEFPDLPATVAADPDAIESAKEAFRDVEPSFRERRAKYLEQILPEAYAVVKNGARRMCGREITVCDHQLTWEMVHFDVQLIGGVALHRGMIAEMQTGEGKTLVATLPVYLNALTGLGVHIVTVNDYLARRDSEWMGSLYKYLGLSVGCILRQSSEASAEGDSADDSPRAERHHLRGHAVDAARRPAEVLVCCVADLLELSDRPACICSNEHLQLFH